MKKVSFIVPIRNKAEHVGECVQSILAQTHSPMEIVLSDQGSEDDSLDTVMANIDRYHGPNTIKILNCPITEYSGAAGLNDHLNWLHEQIDGDIVIMCSADDWNDPRRAERTVQVFEETNCSYVGTRVIFHERDGSETERPWADRHSEMLSLKKAVELSIGSTTSSAWSRDLMQKYGPFMGIEAEDMILPYVACIERGFYYLDEPLHHYRIAASLDNAGPGGFLSAARDETEREQFTEHNNYAYTSNWLAVLRRIHQHAGQDLDPEAYQEIVRKIIYGADLWAQTRDALTMRRIAPIAYRV